SNYSRSDYNAFAFNAQAKTAYAWNTPPFGVGMDWVNPVVTRSFAKLADAVAATGQDAHSIEIGYADLGNVSLPDATNPQRIYAPENYNFAPSATSKLIDAGVVLPTINDGFIGKAP